jgi:hypothetical protein
MAQSRAAGAAWDPEKGCVKTFEDEAVSWMMTEGGFSSFDAPVVEISEAGTGLIKDQDSVGTFDPKAPVPTPSTAPPTQLASGAEVNPVPLPNGSLNQSMGSSDTRSSVTESMFSRISEIANALKKVDNPDARMQQIAATMGLLVAPLPAVTSAPAIPLRSSKLQQSTRFIVSQHHRLLAR